MVTNEMADCRNRNPEHLVMHPSCALTILNHIIGTLRLSVLRFAARRPSVRDFLLASSRQQRDTVKYLGDGT
jgi:hypothetical protein